MEAEIYEIHIEGIVQGVGFRPFVYRHAKRRGYKGWVNNTSDGVHIQINADYESVEHFLGILLDDLPPLAIVTNYSIRKADSKVNRKPFRFEGFEIIHSESKTKPKLLLTPDVGICPHCRTELHSQSNRRYHYPFITCTNCGPRYSIIEALPYDRENTAMAPFIMCKPCLNEYNDPMERRHFSQTNSCPDCRIELQLFENNRITDNFTDYGYIAQLWKQGKIVAIKGIGGYLLTCSAYNSEAVKMLRKRKNRPKKPFALMYPDIKNAQKDAQISDVEKKLLESKEAPIVLLRLKTDLPASKQNIFNEIADNLSRIGVMMPYTPLYELLLESFGGPIVATSGNITNSTIVYEDELAFEYLTKIANGILLNNRRIVVPQDDGVEQYTILNKKKIVLRRSRGRAPVYINPGLNVLDKTVLAVGAQQKSAFGLSVRKNTYVSQYLGNMEHFEAQQNYEKTYLHLTEILKADVEVIIKDKHPDYFSSRFADEKAGETGAKLYTLQHHKAHLYAVLAENNLLSSQEKILGVVWDGTGLGEERNIWGGEFFMYRNYETERIDHLNEFDFILGDKMSKEPRISALTIAKNIPEANKFLKPKFSDTEWRIYNSLLKKQGNLKCTSMGRLFDAVSCILYDFDEHSYEAQASMQLEDKAAQYFYNNQMNRKDSFLTKDIPSDFTGFIFKSIITETEQNEDKAKTAARFHITLVDYILKTAEKYAFKKLAFSGGVFQNALLVDMIWLFADSSYTLYFHKELSPNDECIALGQLAYYHMVLSKNKYSSNRKK